MLESQVVLHSFLLGGNQSLFVRLWAPSWFLSISAVDWSVPWSGYWFCVRCTIQAHVFAGWLVYSQIFRNREGIQPVRHETMDRLCEIRVSACFSVFFCVVSLPKNGKQWSALISRLPFCGRNRVVSCRIHCVEFHFNTTRVEMGIGKVH